MFHGSKLQFHAAPLFLLQMVVSQVLPTSKYTFINIKLFIDPSQDQLTFLPLSNPDLSLTSGSLSSSDTLITSTGFPYDLLTQAQIPHRVLTFTLYCHLQKLTQIFIIITFIHLLIYLAICFFLVTYFCPLLGNTNP